MGVLGVGRSVLAVSMKNLNIFKAKMSTKRDTVKHCGYNSGIMMILSDFIKQDTRKRPEPHSALCSGHMCVCCNL